MVDVVGEAGVGKSRLAYEFQRAIADEATILTGVCIHYGRNINFLPLIDIVRAAFDIEEGMTEEEVGDRIEEKATENLTTMIPFYRNLLSLKMDDPQFNALDPEGRKFGTFEAVKDLLLPLAEEKPMVIFLEDVHWMDKISEEFFTYFSRCMLEHPVLMLAAYRPEGSPPWAQGAHYQRLGLETLSAESSIRLVRNILGGVALEPDLAQKIAEKTGGNPFFVEEIVREFVERGDLEKEGDQYICSRPIHQLEIPNTIQGVLAARMDRLTEDLKQTMQVASVIGRDFGFRILKYITELGKDLKTYLGNLVGLEILYEKALYPELEYIFKHALTQEVAYNSLLKQRRQEVHGRIAQAIEELYSDRLEEHYELLAHHYERSGNVPKAVEYLILSGEKSNQHNAVQAAAEFFARALEVAQSGGVPLDGETEVRLHFGQALANFAIGAIGQSVEGFRKAVELSREQGMIEYEKKCLLHLAPFIWQWPVQAEAEQMYKEGIARTRELEDKALEVLFLTIMASRVAIYEEPYRANQMHIEAGRMAMESGDPVAILMHRIGRHWTERWLGHPQKAIELTEGLVEAMSEMFLLSYLVLMIGGRAVALAEVGRIEDGVGVLRYGIDMCEKFGALWRVGVLYNCLGYCHSEIHQPELAWSLNLKSEEVARRLMEQHPMGTRQWAEIISHASVNLMENLFDQGKPHEAWVRMKAFEKESKSQDFDMARPYVELRMNYLAAQILLQRNEVDHAKTIIEDNLKRARQKQVKKRVGGFLRLLGEVQMRQGETDSAIAHLNEAIITLKELGNPRQLWQAHASLASGYDKMDRPNEAKDQWGAAGAVIQGLANGLSDKELRQGFLQAEPIRAILSKAEN